MNSIYLKVHDRHECHYFIICRCITFKDISMQNLASWKKNDSINKRSAVACLLRCNLTVFGEIKIDVPALGAGATMVTHSEAVSAAR